MDRIKRRAPPEIKENLIDWWNNMSDPKRSAKKFDEYETDRRPIKKRNQGYRRTRKEKTSRNQNLHIKPDCNTSRLKNKIS